MTSGSQQVENTPSPNPATPAGASQPARADEQRLFPAELENRLFRQFWNWLLVVAAAVVSIVGLIGAVIGYSLYVAATEGAAGRARAAVDQIEDEFRRIYVELSHDISTVRQEISSASRDLTKVSAGASVAKATADLRADEASKAAQRAVAAAEQAQGAAEKAQGVAELARNAIEAASRAGTGITPQEIQGAADRALNDYVKTDAFQTTILARSIPPNIVVASTVECSALPPAGAGAASTRAPGGSSSVREPESTKMASRTNS
mgnify:CR=1 FL=1